MVVRSGSAVASRPRQAGGARPKTLRADGRVSKPPARPVRVALVNDYEVILAGIAKMLEPFAEWVELVEIDARCNPESKVDVALFDTYGHRHLGIERVRSLVGEGAVGAVVVYTWSVDSVHRQKLLDAGARGLIAKGVPAESLVRALVDVANGEVVVTGAFRGKTDGAAFPGSEWDLTLRESEVLALLPSGMGNAQIADALFLSENTVRSHLKALYRKLSVANRTQAAAKVLSNPAFTEHLRHQDGQGGPGSG